MSKFTFPCDAKLTDQATLKTALAVLECFFGLSAGGTACQTRDLWQILVLAAVQCTFIETICNDLATAPTSETVWGYLNEQLTPQIIRQLRANCNRALASQLPAWLKDHPKEVALDLHDVPYYGKDDEPDDPMPDDYLRYPQSLKPLKPTVKAGRNDPCPCGSGRKYKKCCMNKQ